MKIRIKFRKHGAMKFIGHLDVMRYFQKAIRRSDINIRYSEGFSPHQIMSFAAPLGVGITSNGEYVDIDVLSTFSSEEAVRRLNDTMSEGFEIVSYRLLPDSAANAMSIVAAADYTLTFRPGYEPTDKKPEEWFREMAVFFDRPEVFVSKKTKKGETQVNLKPLVYELKLTESDGKEGQLPHTPALFMKVSSGSAANVKPDMVLDAFYAELGQERPPFAFLIQREEVYADLASDQEKESGHHRFVSLESLGQEISNE